MDGSADLLVLLEFKVAGPKSSLGGSGLTASRTPASNTVDTAVIPAGIADNQFAGMPRSLSMHGAKQAVFFDLYHSDLK